MSPTVGDGKGEAARIGGCPRFGSGGEAHGGHDHVGGLGSRDGSRICDDLAREAKGVGGSEARRNAELDDVRARLRMRRGGGPGHFGAPGATGAGEHRARAEGVVGRTQGDGRVRAPRYAFLCRLPEHVVRGAFSWLTSLRGTPCAYLKHRWLARHHQGGGSRDEFATAASVCPHAGDLCASQALSDFHPGTRCIDSS